jgi:hypothetical protein
MTFTTDLSINHHHPARPEPDGAVSMTRYAAIAMLLLATGAARADETVYHCNGILTSNGTCIGSESNVNSIGNHEPIYGDSYYTKPDPFRHRDRKRNRQKENDR